MMALRHWRALPLLHELACMAASSSTHGATRLAPRPPTTACQPPPQRTAVVNLVPGKFLHGSAVCLNDRGADAAAAAAAATAGARDDGDHSSRDGQREDDDSHEGEQPESHSSDMSGSDSGGEEEDSSMEDMMMMVQKVTQQAMECGDAGNARRCATQNL